MRFTGVAVIAAMAASVDAFSLQRPIMKSLHSRSFGTRDTMSSMSLSSSESSGSSDSTTLQPQQPPTPPTEEPQEQSNFPSAQEILFNKEDAVNRGIDVVRGSMGFQNDGRYFFMKTGLGFYEEGMRVVNGIPTTTVTANKSEDDNFVELDEAARRRERATESVTNIDDDERQRRIDTGNAALTAAALYACVLSLFVLQNDDILGHVIRLSVFPLYSLGYGFRESGKAGL